MYEGPVQNLIDEFGKLPGIGPKSAQRLAFHLLQVEPGAVERLQAALQAIRDGITYCEVCGTVSAAERCRICSDARRDASMICVVEEPKDIEAIERTREFVGRYHVLGGSLNPLEGIGPNELRIAQLLRRVGESVDGVEVDEIIIATDPNTTGEATATYLARLLRDVPGLVVSRLASGLPMGADLEFADELTLGHALSGRRILSGAPGQPIVRGEAVSSRSGVARELQPGGSDPSAAVMASPGPDDEPATADETGPTFEPAPEDGEAHSAAETEEFRRVPVQHRP